MRLTGVVETARGYGSHDHLRWSYADPSELRTTVVDFLADGLRGGQQVWYVGPESVSALTDHLGGLPDAGNAKRAGALRVAAEVTALAREPQQLDAFARYEHLVDRYMVGHRFTIRIVTGVPRLPGSATFTSR